MASIVNYAQVMNELANDVFNSAEAKGFWDPDDIGEIGIFATKIALIHDEASEALRAHREEYDDAEEDGVTRMTPMQEDDVCGELADIIIRALDLAAGYSLDIVNNIVAKMEKNTGRPYRHGKRY